MDMYLNKIADLRYVDYENFERILLNNFNMLYNNYCERNENSESGMVDLIAAFEILNGDDLKREFLRDLISDLVL